MSVRVLTKVFTHSQSTLAARLVLLSLADSAHDDGVTWINQETLAEKALVSEQTVRRCLKDLEEAGELEKRKAQRGRVRINVYRVVMPGLSEVEYDRLPFDVEPFLTTAQYERSPEVDDRASRPPTTAHLGRDLVDASFKGLNRKENHKTPPEVPPPANRPGKVDRKPVSDAEYEGAAAVLAEFNKQAGTKYASTDYIAKIVMRIREHPELSVEAHALVIRRTLMEPWWRGPASPSVIYGNAALFEQNAHAVLVPVAERGLTPAEIAAVDFGDRA